MNAATIIVSLRGAGITVHGCTAIPGSDSGDIVVFLERRLWQHEEATALLRGLPGVAEVRRSPATEAILYVVLA